MQQAVGSGEELDEGAEIHQPHDLAQVRLAYLGYGCDFADDLHGLAGGSFVGGSDVDCAIVGHIDLDAGLLDDAANHLAAWPDDVTNLIRRNVHGVNARRVLRKGRARLGEGRLHLLEDEQASAARLFERLAHDVRGDVGHLDVHLQRRNALTRARHLEIHIAVMIFGAGDVGEDGVLVALLHQAHGHAAHGRGHWHAGIHQRQARAANRSHRARSIRFQNVADHAQRVRKYRLIGNHRS